MIGIYKVTDLRNQKIIYVGQSFDIKNRITQHQKRTEQLIDKYIHDEGLNNFSFEIVEICEASQLENNKFPHSKISPDDVREIRKRANSGESCAFISKDYPQISQSAVRLIINHKT